MSTEKIVKEKVLNYIKEHRGTDIEELNKNIQCDIGLLVEIIDALLEERKIRED